MPTAGTTRSRIMSPTYASVCVFVTANLFMSCTTMTCAVPDMFRGSEGRVVGVAHSYYRAGTPHSYYYFYVLAYVEDQPGSSFIVHERTARVKHNSLAGT
jgi:hypothetical protein